VQKTRKKEAGGETQVRITPNKRITMTDVARAAGCSQSTVSVVLNNAPGIIIAGETRRRVMRAATNLGYVLPRTGVNAASIPRQISIIFDYIATSPEAIVSIDGARETAWKTGHVVSAFQTHNDARMQPITIAAAVGPSVEAVIYATIMTREVVVPRELYETRLPVVLLNCYTHDRAFPSVLPGEVAGGHLATRALARAGHRRIAHITGEMWMDAAKSRLKGYRQALASAEIPFDPTLVRKGNWQTGSGYEHTMALMKLSRPPTAIFCSNDRMAIGCYEALKERGLKIPADVSVVGYDDEEVAAQLAPQLTSLILPHREMGHWAVETALEHLSGVGRREQYPLVKLECMLVERDSIARPRD
jgi:LacI family transcriptional regulator, galactose operon repressor